MTTSNQPSSPAPDYDNSVADVPDTKRPGRPKTGFAMTQAQRDARYRAKKRFQKVCQELRAAGLSPLDLLLPIRKVRK